MFLQAREVEPGSHGLQQQPVLQGQPIPLQVEYETVSAMGGWVGGEDKEVKTTGPHSGLLPHMSDPTVFNLVLALALATATQQVDKNYNWKGEERQRNGRIVNSRVKTKCKMI